MNKEINWDLISKVLTDNATEKETVRFNKWLNQDVENAALFSDLLNYIEGEEDIHQSFKVYNSLSNKLQLPVKLKHKKPARAYFPLRIAASILFFLSLSYAITFYWGDIRQAILPVTLIETVTHKGSRMHIELEDGTSVWLNAESKISYPEKFSKRSREVVLSGEAYFEVAHDKNRPFVIRTEHLETTVLGTSFNINAYENRSYEEVTLLSGEVKINTRAMEGEEGSSHAPTYLRANNMGVFTKESGSIKAMAIIDAADSKAWTEGRLVFKQAEIGDIIEVLNRKFNVNIMLTNRDIARCRISAKFNNQNLNKTLRLLTQAAGIQYKINGKIITLYGNACN